MCDVCVCWVILCLCAGAETSLCAPRASTIHEKDTNMCFAPDTGNIVEEPWRRELQRLKLTIRNELRN